MIDTLGIRTIIDLRSREESSGDIGENIIHHRFSDFDAEMELFKKVEKTTRPDLLDEDVIATNRQAINWENEELAVFREWLSDLISKVGLSWRDKRKKDKDKKFEEKTGIDKEKWFSTLPEEIRKPVETIVNTLSNDEGVYESFHPVVLAVHMLAPEYPNLHWRHLHPEIQAASNQGYKEGNYYFAFSEAIKRYTKKTREYSGCHAETDFNLMGKVFGDNEDQLIKVAIGYLRANGTNFAPTTLKNIELAQRKFSQGVVAVSYTI